MEDAFWFAGGPTCIKEVKGVLAVDGRRRTVRIDILQFAMPPDVAAFLHVNLVSRATKNDDAPD